MEYPILYDNTLPNKCLKAKGAILNNRSWHLCSQTGGDAYQKIGRTPFPISEVNRDVFRALEGQNKILIIIIRDTSG